jgi:LPPG:FO 2-phospho-L-lactate transferase
MLGRLGGETWFQLGDRDLATHLYRTRRLREGATLAAVTAELSAALGVRSSIVPMTNDRVRTRVCTPLGELEFQRYFVQRRATDQVLSLRFEGAEHAAAAPGLIEAIGEAAAIIVCPSNPFISIGPILAVGGVREALRNSPACVPAVSPIVGGRALKGPTADMMRSMGIRPSAVEVARLYSDFVKVFVLDETDREQSGEVEALGMRPVVTNTIMRGVRERKALARTVVRELGVEE